MKGDETKIQYYASGRAYTAYKRLCDYCDSIYYAARKTQRYCGKKCANSSLRSIRDPMEHFYREKITRVKSSARNRGLSFSLSWEDVRNLYEKQKGLCFYTGRTLNLTYSTKTVKVCPPDQLSIDRVDSSKGYSRDNIVLCCYALNVMKGDSEVRDFIDYIRAINSRPLEVKVKKLHPDAVLPTYSRKGDGALDLTAVSYKWHGNAFIQYHTGLAFEIPEGYVGLIFPRSSVSKCNLSLCNSVGVIDSGYRGEVTLRYRPTSKNPMPSEMGMRIGQILILPYPQITFVEAAELTTTARGAGGYGSTG